jgi:23S rRNA pseudouridine1911/1915/1917 synthase
MIISSHQAEEWVVSDAQEDSDLSTEVEIRRVNAPMQCHGARLDRTLANVVPEFSRSYLQQLISAGAVQLNSSLVSKSSTKVKAGDDLIVELRPTPQSVAFKPESMQLDVVFEDEFMLVVNKPAGLVVHPAPGNWSGTLLNGLLGRDAQAAVLPRAGIVHRLDKDTSGLMVVARTRQTMDQLVSMIAARAVSRQYLALGHGSWKGPTTRRVDLPVGRDPRNRLRMAVVDIEKNAGKLASTDISLVTNGANHCLVRCSLHTGRTHQIRVHMAALGHCLVSDELYGGKPDGNLQRQALHAYRLAFKHPVTQQNLAFDSALPEDIHKAIENVGLVYT